MSKRPLVSVVIVTRNRKEHLLTAIESCRAQTYRPLEIRVFDEASTDGTQEAIGERFPEVIFSRVSDRVGYIVLRNKGIREAKGTFIFSIDDDAYFTDENTITDTVALFEKHPDAGVVALPFAEPTRPQEEAVPGTIDGNSSNLLRGFTGCAAAYRRGAVLDAGGYREFFEYRAEERDLSIRLMKNGMRIYRGNTPPIIHLYGGARNWEQITRYNYRNTLLFDCLNLPHPYVLPAILVNSIQLYLYKLRLNNCLARIGYLLGGYAACVKYRRHRSPVSRATYKRYRSLPGHGPIYCDTAKIPPPLLLQQGHVQETK